MSQAMQSEVRFHTQTGLKYQQKSHKTIRLIFMVSCISLATFYAGYCIAYIIALGTQNLNIVYGDTAVIPLAKGFLIASIPFGICFGTFLSPWVLPLATRRNLTLILCIIGLGLQGVVQIRSLIAFYIARFCQGTVSGLFLVLIPVYIKEITPKSISMKIGFSIFEKLFVLFGLVVCFGYNTIMLKKQVDQVIRWRIIISANSIPILLLAFLILIKFIPESPNSLISKGRLQESKKTIALYHPLDVIQSVYQLKQRQIKPIEAIPQYPPKKVSKLKTFLSLQIPIVHQLSGVNAIISQMGYATSFHNFGFSQYVPFLMSAVQFITCIISVTYISKVSPRILILLGNVGMSFSLFAIGAGFIVVSHNNDFFWLMIVFLVFLLAFNGGTFIPVVGIYVAEVGHKKSIRWSLVLNWFFCGWTIVIFVTVGARFSFAAVFFTFGICTLIGFVYNVVWMVQTRPETKVHASIQLRDKIDNNKDENKMR